VKIGGRLRPPQHRDDVDQLLSTGAGVGWGDGGVRPDCRMVLAEEDQRASGDCQGDRQHRRDG
jgi:hypothetical protein